MVHAPRTIFIILALIEFGLIALAQLPNRDAGLRILSVCILYIVAYFPYLVALYFSRNCLTDNRLEPLSLVAAIAFRLAAIGPAVLTTDTLRYGWEASALDRGFNPYRTTPISLGDSGIPGPDLTAVYGPWLEAVHWLAYRLTAGQWLQLSAALADSLTLAFLWRRLRSGQLPLFRWLLYAWSPLAIFEFWRNGHNDAWVVLFLLWALSGGRWLPLTLAVLTKWWPALLWPLWWRRYGWRGGALSLLATLAIVAALLAPAEWWLKIRFTTGFLGGWTNNAFLYHLLANKQQALALLAAAALVAAWLKTEIKLLVLALTTFLLAFSANIHPWYLSWLLPGLVLTRVNPLPWLLPMALIPLAYDTMLGQTLAGFWREDPSLRWLIWVPVLVFPLWYLRPRRNG